MNLREHSGTFPDQVPSSWQILIGLPFIWKSSSHEYQAWLANVLDRLTVSTMPLLTSGGGPQSTNWQRGAGDDHSPPSRHSSTLLPTSRWPRSHQKVALSPALWPDMRTEPRSGDSSGEQRPTEPTN